MKDANSKRSAIPTSFKLTPKQEAYCQAIVVGNSQSDAYRLAYNASQMKDKTVWKRSGELMADGAVAGRLAALRAENAKVVQASKEDWLQEVERCAFFDVRRLFGADGRPLEISTLTLEDAACISGFEIVEKFAGRGGDRKSIGFTKKFKLADKLRALELFGKATGYYVERMEIHDKGPLADLATAVLLKMQAELQGRIALQGPAPVDIGGEKP